MKKIRITLFLDEAIAKEFKKMAIDESLTMSQLIAKFIYERMIKP